MKTDKILMMGEVVAREIYSEHQKQKAFAIDNAGYTHEEFATFWGSFDMIGAKQFAELYVEAHNTVIETGLTPLQLQLELEKAKELFKYLLDVNGIVHESDADKVYTFLEGSGLQSELRKRVIDPVELLNWMAKLNFEPKHIFDEHPFWNKATSTKSYFPKDIISEHLTSKTK